VLLVPFERLALESSRPADELVAALARLTEPPPMQFRVVRTKPTSTFVGEVSKERLYFRRAIYGRNSFAPFVIGKIVSTASGARIEAVMRPNGIVLGFMGVFTATLAPVLVLSVAELLQRGTLEGFVWQPAFMLVALFAGCMLGFVPEARRMKRLLREVAGDPAKSVIMATERQ
jgi:hypothetical protein